MNRLDEYSKVSTYIFLLIEWHGLSDVLLR